jgi:hypothetical protein
MKFRFTTYNFLSRCPWYYHNVCKIIPILQNQGNLKNRNLLCQLFNQTQICILLNKHRYYFFVKSSSISSSSLSVCLNFHFNRPTEHGHFKHFFFRELFNRLFFARIFFSTKKTLYMRA